MFILWRRTNVGYTVVDTSDYVEEEYDRPTLRKIVRSGVQVQGITIDEKNVIHFVAQSKEKNNASISAAQIRGKLTGAYSEDRHKYVVPPCAKTERYDIPFVGADATYVLTDATFQNADIISLPMGVKRIMLSAENPVHIRGIIIPPTARVLTSYNRMGMTQYDFHWYLNHCYLDCIPPVSDLRYLHDFENCANRRISWYVSSLRIRGSFWITDPVCRLDDLAIVPDIANISRSVEQVASYHSELRIEGITFGKDRAKYKRASLDTAEWVFNHQSTYIEELESKGVSERVPRLVQFEDVRQIEKLDLGVDTAGMVFAVPRGQKEYFINELLPSTLASRNIVIEF